MFNNSTSQIIKYTYDATGVKLRKEIPGKITDYAGNFIYEGGTLQFFNHPEGYVSYDGGQFNYIYDYVDHLGNVRLSYTDGNGDGSIDPAMEIIQEKNYYPFGLTHQGYNGGGGGSAYGNAAAKRYGFGGKELQSENISGSILDWYDVSARNYDPALGRWMNLDPLAEQMRRHSPYNYAFDNPIYFIDPDGMAPMSPMDDIYLNRNGKEIFRVENDQPDRTFVVKTTKTTEQLYDGGTRDGNSNPITKKEAKQTEKLIKSGNVEGDHMSNTVQIANADTQQQMLDHVSQDNGNGGVISESNLKSMDSNNFKEFSGNIDENGNVVDKSTGPVTLPMAGTSQAEAGGDFGFHSHPSGQFTDTDGNTRSFTQPTSNRDISNAKGIEYSFGMGSKKVYIYNKTGVVAIIPFKNFGKKE